MPIITVFPDVIRAYNRVEIDWADNPDIVWAKVTRVDAITGQCTPLRPYICFFGDYLNVSCDGHGIFWDTEVPLDRSVYYITEGLDANLVQPCIPAGPVVSDTFTRILAASWGSADTGQVWTNTGGAAADYSVTGTLGRHTVNTVNVTRYSIVAESVTDSDLSVDVLAGPLATGAPYDMGLAARRDSGANSDYTAEIVFKTSGLVHVQLRKTIAGVGTLLATSADSPSIPTFGEILRLRFTVVGNTLSASFSDSDGFGASISVTDNSLTGPGEVGIRSFRDAANTNAALPADYDNFLLSGACLPCTPVTGTTQPSTMPSNGAFRLKDPVRPCNDLYVPLCFDQVADPSCLPGSGIFFAQVDTESYDANTLVMNPTNASRPIAVTRARRDKASLLQLVTRTFDDRDNLLKINQPGSPLLLQGPPNYGLPDAYISVGTLSIERGLTDHRFPVRINNLPFVTVDRPAGPSQGVCGSRVQDTCDIFDSWADLTAEGFVYEDLVRGRASNDGNPPSGDIRTYDDVNTEFASYNAVNTGGRTYADLMAGD